MFIHREVGGYKKREQKKNKSFVLLSYVKVIIIWDDDGNEDVRGKFYISRDSKWKDVVNELNGK